MAIKQLTPTLSVTAQLTPADIAQAAAMGFRAILCNRPDGEGADQPTAEEMGAAARAAGLDFAYVPAVAGALTDADAIAMRAALTACRDPCLPIAGRAHARKSWRRWRGHWSVRTLPIMTL